MNLIAMIYVETKKYGLENFGEHTNFGVKPENGKRLLNYNTVTLNTA